MSLASTSSFDRNAQQLVEHFEATPPAHAWAAIAARLPEEKNRKFFAWWWLGGLLIAGLLGSVLYWSLQTSSAGATPEPETKALQYAFAVDADSNEDCGQQRKIGEEHLVEETETAALTSLATFEQPSSLAATTDSKLNRGAGQRAVISSGFRQNKSAQRSVALDVEKTKEALKARVYTLTDTPIAKASTRSNIASALTQPTVPPTETEAKLPFLLPNRSLNELSLETSEWLAGQGIPCEDFSSRGYWSLGARVFAGPGQTTREFTSSANDLPAYLALRDSTEELQLSIHAGLRFEAIHSKGLFLRIGADYQMYRSNLTVLGPISTRTVSDTIRDQITGEIIRTDTRTESTQSESRVYNRHQTITLTGGIGFRKTFGRVSPYLMAEAGYELLLKTRGQLMDPAGLPVQLESEDQRWIEERPGLRFGGVLGVDFNITDNIAVGVSAHYNQLSGLRGSADPLNYDQSSIFGALNLRYGL